MNKHRNILIVDDEENILTMLSRILVKEDYQTITARNTAEAFDILQREEVSLCLLDINMPGQSGDTFLKKLKRIYPDVAVIMSTGDNSAEMADLCTSYGADDYLVKPFDPERLIISVRNTLHRRVLMQEKRLYNNYLKEKLHEQAEKLKTSQILLVQQEKLAGIGQLAAGVAHEINNPLGYIKSNLYSLKKYSDRMIDYCSAMEDFCQQLTEAQQQEFKDIKDRAKIEVVFEDMPDLLTDSQEGVQLINKIVQNLKSFSRTDNDEAQTFDVNECLENAITMVWNEIKYTAQLERNLAGLPPVIGFRQQLAQVFMNILVNASHAITEDGLIQVETTLENDRIKVKIQDNGSGISPDNLKKIFDPFFTTKPSGQGTGLGMSIVFDIVKKHNGQITVNSVPGEGTAVIVDLPVAPSD